ncbi:unnamed protein product [Fusarium graminearum]|nr:unnamed protein product [Fusarium graminearum]
MVAFNAFLCSDDGCINALDALPLKCSLPQSTPEAEDILSKVEPKNQDFARVGSDRIPAAINALVALTNACAKVHLDHIVLLEDDHFPGQEFRPTLDPSTIYTPSDTIFGGLIKYGVFQPGFLEHFELFDRSRLDQLLVKQPKNVLDPGSRRYCKSRHAEAIMSVLEVKNLFENIGNSACTWSIPSRLHFSQSAKWPVRDFQWTPLSFTPLFSRQGLDSPTTDISSRQVFPGFLREEYKLSPEALVKIGQWASVADRAPPKTLNTSVNLPVL